VRYLRNGWGIELPAKSETGGKRVSKGTHSGGRFAFPWRGDLLKKIKEGPKHDARVWKSRGEAVREVADH